MPSLEQVKIHAEFFFAPRLDASLRSIPATPVADIVVIELMVDILTVRA